jgi:outer membrane protein OmpA-like peptidoglycan-associated protein
VSGRAVAAIILLVLSAAACASRPEIRPPAPRAQPRPDLFVVLPGPGGTAGAITVVRGTDQHVLDSAYAALRIGGDGRLEPARLGEAEVRDAFGPALGAQPQAPTSFILYFTFGTDQLTPESTQELAKVLAEVQKRPAPDVDIIGHTDRAGTDAQNDELSLKRAMSVRASVLRLGVPEDRIQTAGRGEREPRVPTADGVEEPLNRRVEITVR